MKTKNNTTTTNIIADAKHQYTWETGAYSFSLFIKDNRYIYVTKVKNEEAQYILDDTTEYLDKSTTSSSSDDYSTVDFPSTDSTTAPPSQDDKEDKETIVNKKGMSSIERTFWITILIFALIFATVFFMAFLNTKEVSSSSANVNKPRTLMDDYIDKYFPTDKLKENLLAKQEEINEHLEKEIDLLNITINREVNNIFSVMEYRIDDYLDYHYSVAGEYEELYAMASNKIDKLIEEKLIGSDFNYKLQVASDNIYAQYKERIEEHLSLLNTIALEGVDTELEINRQTMQQLQGEVIKNQMLQEGKFGLLISGMLAKKISMAITAKIAAKASGKLAVKGAAKVGAKAASIAGAGAMGLACGPLAVVCGAGLAIGAWLVTDAVIVAGDEHLNRDSFRSQINSMISNQKYTMQRNFQRKYAQTLETMSHSTQAKIAMSQVHEKRRVKVSDQEF